LTLDEPLALAWGRGDRLVPLPALPRHDVALACFPFGVSTPDAFTWLDDAHADVAAGASAVELGQLVDWAHVARLAHNDFEAVVAPHFPAIAATLAAWRSRATQLGDAGAFALLTGSGSTVFLTAEHVPSDIASLPDASVRVVQTATATRVVDVELSD